MLAPQFHPVTEIPIPITDGIWPTASVRFDDSSTHLLITYHAPLVNFRTFWNEHAADVCGITSLLIFLYLVRLLVDTVRRPQVAGRFYCRKCNYEINSANTTICPECGTSLASLPPAAGRSPVRRPLLKLLILVPLLLLTLFTWKTHIERRTGVNTTWPLASLRYFSWWPVATPIHPPIPSTIFEIYSIPDYKLVSRSTIEDFSFEGDVTSDFRYFARVEVSPHKRLLAAIYDVADGERHTIDLGDSVRFSGHVRGFSSSGNDAVFLLESNPDLGGAGSISIASISLGDLSKRDLGQIPYAAGPTQRSSGAFAPTMLATVGGSPERWAILCTDGAQAGQLWFGTTRSPSVPSELQLNADPRFSNISAIRFIDADTLRLFNSILPLHDVTLPEGSIALTALPPSKSIQVRGDYLEIISNLKVIRKILIEPAFRAMTGTFAFSTDGRWLVFHVRSTGLKDQGSKFIVIDLTIPDSPQPPGP